MKLKIFTNTQLGVLQTLLFLLQELEIKGVTNIKRAKELVDEEIKQSYIAKSVSKRQIQKQIKEGKKGFNLDPKLARFIRNNSGKFTMVCSDCGNNTKVLFRDSNTGATITEKTVSILMISSCKVCRKSEIIKESKTVE